MEVSNITPQLIPQAPTHYLEATTQLQRPVITKLFPRHDNVVTDAPSFEAPPEILDILEADKEAQFHELIKDPMLGGAILNSTDTHDHVAKEKFRIDPRLFLLSKETVREWYYTVRPTYEKISVEEYKQKPVEEMRPALFDRHFSFPTDPAQKIAYYKTHAISFLTQELIGNIFKTARRIIEVTTSQDRIVIFGNTPYFVGRAIELLTKNTTESRQLIYFPFSGAPNTSSDRNGGFAKFDLVTSARLEHLKARLAKAGLGKDNPQLLQGTTYFVDVIGAGSGPAYTMEVILRDFMAGSPSLETTTLPALKIISLNEMGSDANDERHSNITSHLAKDGEHFELSFPSKQQAHFKIQAQVIKLPDHSILDFGPDNCPSTRIVPKYNACYWSDEFDYILEGFEKVLKNPENATGMTKILLNHFDTNINEMLSAQD